MNASNNVVLFPIQRIANPAKTALASKKVPQSVKEIKDIIYLLKVDKIDEIMDIMTPLIANGLSAFNITSIKGSEIKRCALVFESLRSMLYGHFGLDHPIQDFADKLFEEKDGELTVLKLNVTIKDK